MSPDHANPDRLARAIQSLLQHQRDGKETDEQFLRRCEDLRDLLEPMLEEPGDDDRESAAESRP